MRHKIFCKKFKSSLILTVVAAVILSFVLSSAAIMHPVRAASSNQGSAYSAKAKLIFLAFDHCFQNSGNGNNLTVSKDGNGLSIGLSGLGDGYYLESSLDGSGTDNNSVWSCTDLGKHLEILQWIGIDYKNDLLCNGDGYGLITPNSSYRCQDIIQDILNGKGGAMTVSSGALDYLDSVIANKTFGGKENIPGCYAGGYLSACLANFTDLEKYYMYLDAFKEKCAVSTSYGTDPSSGGVGIPEVNSNGEIEMHYYSVQNRSVKIYADHRRSDGYYNGDQEKYTCKQVAENLLSTNGVAVKDGLAKELGEKCQEAYTNAVNTTKGWWDEHKGEYTDAQSAVDQFFASHSATATAYAYDSSKPSFTCKANDFIDQWNTLKDQFGFTGTPNLEGYTGEGSSDDQGSNGDSQATCGSQAGSLGWIVCPGVESLAEGTDGIYGALAGLLNINPELFSADADKSPTFQMWYYFRTFANIALAIILLIIILSQLTGVGIDNYGIKKMLPRIIVAAILINISYYICQGAIDISNILGNGLSKGLDAIAENTARAVGVDTLKIAAAGFLDILAGVIALAGGAATAAIGPITIAASAGISVSFWILMIPLIISLLVALVAVLIFFLMLGARKLIVMVCIAIAPLAFLCYILPNTQKLFDRWISVMKGLLLVYPICSLLYGVSRMIRILAFSSSSADIWMVMLAIMASFLPYLIAPGLLRSSFRGLGEIGARISGMGAAVRRGANDARRSVMTSEMFKTANQQAADYRTTRTATRLRERYGGETAPTAPGAGASRRDQRRYRHAQARYDNHQRRLAQAQLRQDDVEAREASRRLATDPNYIQNQAQLREDRNNRMLEDAVLSQINRDGEYNGIQYGDGGKDLTAVAARFVELSNLGDNANQSQQIERNALQRKLASEKVGVNFLNDMIYQDDGTRDGGAYAGRRVLRDTQGNVVMRDGNAVELNADGLRSMNAYRIRNNDVGAAMAKKDTTGSMYLDDLAAGTRNGNESIDDIGRAYAARALSDSEHINDQSGASLRRFANYIPHRQITNLLNDDNFQQIITDEGNRQILQNTTAGRANQMRNTRDAQNAANAEAARQATEAAQHAADANQRQIIQDNTRNINDNLHIQNATTAGRHTAYLTHGHTGVYYAAPRGWNYDAGASTPNHPVFVDPNDPNHRYDALRNRFL